MGLFEMTILAPWAILLIYLAVFIASAFVMFQIDWARFMNKEMQTPLMGTLLGMIATLVVTFCIGTLFVVFGSMITNLF